MYTMQSERDVHRAIAAGSVTDLNMPGMDGIDLIKHIRTKSAHKYIPILMLTTESQPAKKEAAKAAGATCWMVKPFRPEQLLAVVSRVPPLTPVTST
jgi:two-component system chemotaxis response regulator CheY